MLLLTLKRLSVSFLIVRNNAFFLRVHVCVSLVCCIIFNSVWLDDASQQAKTKFLHLSKYRVLLFQDLLVDDDCCSDENSIICISRSFTHY